ncbi:MAG TPA: chemotaxis protein CheX [Polyangiaceae bacterium]|jgi:CheY-specific phosphatase CheX|nr:chemotaxis protein CheX [Polyangiaceae bacterium]
MARKYVLLVDDVDGPLWKLAPELKSFDFRVVVASEAERALVFVKAAPRLSLVVVNESVVEGSADVLLREIKTLEPTLPVIWIGNAGSANAPSEQAPDAVLNEPVSVASLQEVVSKMLREHFYPSNLVEELVRGLTGAMQAFSANVVAGAPYLASSTSTLSEVNALITFTGHRAAGHLMIGCSVSSGKDLFSRMFPGQEPSLPDVEDLVGEICNQALGSLKAFFVGHASTLDMGTPRFIRAESGSIRYEARRPCLGLEVQDGDISFAVDFHFERFDPETVREQTPERLIESGAFKVL